MRLSADDTAFMIFGQLSAQKGARRTIAELAKAVARPRPVALAALRALVSGGLVLATDKPAGTGRGKLFQANDANPIFPELRQVALKMLGPNDLGETPKLVASSAELPLRFLPNASRGALRRSSEGDLEMTVEISGVSCNACGHPLVDARPDDAPDERTPCPECGSRSRHISVHVEDRITFHSDLAIKKKTPGFRSGGRSRPAQEQWSGDVLSREGVWRERQRVVDRENNRYIERITEPDGTVIHEVEEPLDQHFGHGSDKA